MTVTRTNSVLIFLFPSSNRRSDRIRQLFFDLPVTVVDGVIEPLTFRPLFVVSAVGLCLSCSPPSVNEAATWPRPDHRRLLKRRRGWVMSGQLMFGVIVNALD